MSDVIGGPSSGAEEHGAGLWSGGSPPPVLLAALGLAALVALSLVAFLVGSCAGSDDGQTAPAGAAAPPAENRVLLAVSFLGGGSGRVHIARGVSCNQYCEHDFATGTRLTVTAHAASGSTFERWGDACSGDSDCAIVMDRQRSLTVKFEGAATIPKCADGLAADADTGCGKRDDLPARLGDCHDGRDNDDDGLVDSAQDPGCDKGGDEAEVTLPAPPAPTAPTTTTTTPPPPPVAVANECADGRDNDGDGLVDRAQDPNCATGTSERGTTGATRSE